MRNDFTDNSTIEVSEGNMVVDVQYYERVGPDNELEFHIEDKATIHLESVLRVSNLGVQEEQAGGGGVVVVGGARGA